MPIPQFANLTVTVQSCLAWILFGCISDRYIDQRV